MLELLLFYQWGGREAEPPQGIEWEVPQSPFLLLGFSAVANGGLGYLLQNGLKKQRGPPPLEPPTPTEEDSPARGRGWGRVRARIREGLTSDTHHDDTRGERRTPHHYE